MLRMQEMAFQGFKFACGRQPFLSPSNILSHTKVPFQKMPPPPPHTGKFLKKGPDQYTKKNY